MALRSIILLITILTGGAAIASGDAAAPKPDGLAADQRLEEIFAREWAFRLKEFPTMASSVGIHDYDHRLGHFSAADELRRYEFWQSVKQELADIECENLSRPNCINFKIFSRQIDRYIINYDFHSYQIPFNSDWGFYIGWAQLPTDTEFSTDQDYVNYLSRLRELPQVMDEYIEVMRMGLKSGMTQPKVILKGRDVPIKQQLVEHTEDSSFYAPFITLPDWLAEGRQEFLRLEASAVIGNGVIPAYRKLLDFMEKEYRPGARKSLGASELPNGEAFYQAQILHFATVEMSPAEIHQLGLEEVARIRADMERIIQQLEFDGDFADFLKFLRTDPQFYAKTPKQLLAEASYFAKKIDGRLPQLFGHLPRQPYGVAAVPADIAPFFTTGRAVGAPLDAKRGGYYWVNTYDLPNRPLYAIPALTLHEGAPGHLTQGALALELDEQPPFRRFNYISAYGEGWGLYAEKLGLEMDIYETPYQHFGRLTYEMWRACRLVIDTGLHAMGWSRKKAVRYLASNSALALHNVNTEIDRYISWPAQALSYKIGEHTIWQLRREAQQQLDQSFDIRAFHDFILSLGSVPLDVLRDEVQRWISDQSPGVP